MELILDEPALEVLVFQRQVGEDGTGMVLFRLVYQAVGSLRIFGATQIVTVPVCGNILPRDAPFAVQHQDAEQVRFLHPILVNVHLQWVHLFPLIWQQQHIPQLRPEV